jgi:TRAP-type C4-dicarboxylate transport system substrate-binding protein
MPDEYKQIVNESMQEAADYLFDLAKAKNDEMLTSLEGVGMNIIDPDPELKAELKKAAEEVENMIREKVGDEVVDSLVTATEEASK